MRGGDHAFCRSGFTLVEVVVALTVLAVGLLGLSAAAGAAAYRMNLSLLETRVTTSAQGQLDDLLARRLSSPASGARRTGDVEISWWVGGDDLREIRVVATGRLACSTLTDTLTTLARPR